jgi:hypothetical protein
MYYKLHRRVHVMEYMDNLFTNARLHIGRESAALYNF